MYDERPYGDILRDERERAGYDLNTMSRRLHIRPDILQAIERSDFDRMPARGYSKNMVRAYARALHLDDRAITDMFLDQAHMHDVGESRRPSNSRSSRQISRGGNYSRDTSPRSTSRRGNADSRYSDSRSYGIEDEPSRSRRRSEYSKGEPRERSYGRDSRYNEPSRSRQIDRESPSRRGGLTSGAAGLLQSFANRSNRQETKVGRSFDTIGSTPPYARNNNGGNRNNSLSGMNMPLLLIIVAALIVLIIVVVVVTNGSQQAVEKVPDIPISGLTDTSNSASDEASGSSSDDDVIDASSVVLPTDVEVDVEVADGKDSWIEIYENGSSTPSVAKVFSGPDTQVFDVSTSIRIRTANPSAVTITVDGEQVEMTNEGNGNYSYSFSFNDYLKKWKKDNGVEDVSSKSKKSNSSSKSKSV